MSNWEKLECSSSENTHKCKPDANPKCDTIERRIIKSEKEFDALESEWNLLCERTDSHIFQTYDWNRTWWNHFGAKGELQIFALYDRDTLVGIAPLFFDRTHIIGIKPYSCLRFIGSYISKIADGVLLGTKSYSDYLQFLIDKDYLNVFFRHFSDFLMHEIYFDELILEEVPENSSTLTILECDFSHNGYEVNVNNASVSYNILPENSWEDYLNNLTSKERNNVRRSQKKMGNTKKKLFCVEDLQYPTKIAETINRFIELHQKQWNIRGLPGSFAETCMHQFFMDVSQKLYKNGQLNIKTLQPVGTNGLKYCFAIDVNLEYKDRIYGQHRALDITSPYFKKAPGKVLLTATIKDAVLKQKTFDFLRGQEKYKERLATAVKQNKNIRIGVSSVHRKWAGRILTKIYGMQKKIAVESVRFHIIKDQNKYSSAIFQYISSVLERIIKRFFSKSKS